MRPQGFGGQIGGGLEDLGWDDMGFEPPKPADADRDSEHDAFGEELTNHPSRNPLAALTPIASPVHDQQAEIADRLTGEGDEDEDESFDEEFDETAELVDVEDVARMPEAATAPVIVPVALARPRRQSKPRAAPGSKGKAAFTLRLDPGRHLKLRLACAVTARSAQQIVTDAVDRLLADMPELDTMAERAPSKRAQA
jgi:hypothetical protein